MNQKLTVIIDNLTESFDGKPWYGISTMEKLNTISWEIVNDKIYGSKSIAVLVQHILNWRIFVLKKLEGDAAYVIPMDSENDWTPIQIKNDEAWNTLKEKLIDSQNKLLQKLASYSDELLTQKVPGKAYSFEPILTSIAQHDIYHLGQIAMLNTMRKS